MRRGNKPRNMNNPLPHGEATDYPVHISFRVSEETFHAIERDRGTTHRSRWVRGLIEQLTGTEKKNGQRKDND